MAVAEVNFATLRTVVHLGIQVPALTAQSLPNLNPLIVRDVNNPAFFNVCLSGKIVGRIHEPLGAGLASLLDSRVCRMTG